MLQQFLSFDKLIGTKLIKILYFLGMIVILLAGLVSIVNGLLNMKLVAMLGGIIGTGLMLIFWRFMCEIYMLFFRMSDDLRDIKNHQMGRPENNTNVNIGGE